MAKLVALIANATSRNGSQAAKQLLAQGKHTVRLAARAPAKLADLVSRGAEAIAVDPLNADSVTQAFTGVDYVYLILPTVAKDQENIMFRNYLQAAHATGIKHIVYLSSIEAAPADSATHKPVHNHYENEQELLASGIPSTCLRPGWFYENLLSFRDEIKNTGEFKTSADDGVYATVAVQDIAAVVEVVLNHPGPHAGKTYPLTTEAVSEGTVAAVISKVTGQKVRHVNLTPEEFIKRAVKKMGGGSAAEELAARLATLDFEKRESLFSKLYPDLEQLLGHKGISLEDYLAQHAVDFKQA